MMKASSTLLMIIATALAGCAGPSSEVFLAPDGSTLAQVDCVSEQSECFATAAETCGGTYRVVDSWSNAGGSLADWVPGPFTWYHMQIICGPSDGRMPDFEFRGSKYVPPAYDPPKQTTCTGMGNTVNCTTR